MRSTSLLLGHPIPRVEHWVRSVYAVCMETYVCGNCIDDYAVKEFIRRKAEVSNCDYCHQSSQSFIAASLSDVGAFMCEGLEMEWSHPDDEAVAWDSEDGCYVVSTLDSYDLVDRYLGLDFGELRDDFADQLGDRDWCQKNPYRLERKPGFRLGEIF